MTDRPIIIDLNTPVRLADVPALAARVAAWWWNQVVQLVPGWAQRAMPKQAQPALLEVRDGAWRLVPPSSGAAPIAIDTALDDKGVADALLRAAPDFSLSRLVALLEPSSVLRRRVELPMMPDAQVRAAVELQIDRLSPFKADNVRFAVRIAGRDAVDGKLQADIAITPRVAVDALEERISRLGLGLAAIDVADTDGGRAGFDFRQHGMAPVSRRTVMTRLLLAVAAVGSWYLAGIMWDTAREQEAASWQEEIAALRPQAQRSATLRTQLEAMRQPIELARAHDPTLALDLLRELTTVLPDTARLTEFRLEGDAVDIAGLASDAPALIARLDASPRFRDVKFRSPVMRRAESGKDRFEVSMRVEGGVKP